MRELIGMKDRCTSKILASFSQRVASFLKESVSILALSNLSSQSYIYCSRIYFCFSFSSSTF